jgi:hypothetical protein
MKALKSFRKKTLTVTLESVEYASSLKQQRFNETFFNNLNQAIRVGACVR